MATKNSVAPGAKPVSGWQVEQALAVWNAARSRLLDEELEHDERALAEILGPAEGDVRELLARALRASVQAKAMSEMAKEMADATASRAARYMKRAETMKGVAMGLMECLQETRAEYPDVAASISNGRKSVIITNEAKLADEYVNVTRTPDKKAIKADLDVGVVIDGAELSNGLPTLTIRTK